MGRHVFGVAALIFAALTLTWHVQLQSAWHLPGAAAFIYLTSLAQAVGGVAIQFGKTERLGAVLLGLVYLVFALTWAPAIIAAPGVYNSWGNVFERLSMVAGAMVVYGFTLPQSAFKNVCKAGVLLFGVCVVSFTVTQAIYLRDTAGLVPKWIPPNQLFWAVATTIAFGLAAISILSGYKALLASRLLTVMLLLFGIVVWIPICIAVPSNHFYWSENVETFTIAAAAWIVADAIALYGPGETRVL
jgi:hypothetical protein